MHQVPPPSSPRQPRKESLGNSFSGFQVGEIVPARQGWKEGSSIFLGHFQAGKIRRRGIDRPGMRAHFFSPPFVLLNPRILLRKISRKEINYALPTAEASGK